MSRRKKKPTRRVEVPIERLNAIVERTRTEALPEADHATLKAAVDTLARLTAELESAKTSLARVQRIVFGSSSETTAGVLGEAKGATAAGTLTVRLHHSANAATDQVIEKLCEELNATETVFPRTNLRLVLKLGSA